LSLRDAIFPAFPRRGLLIVMAFRSRYGKLF
jgi:hypothetical protein